MKEARIEMPRIVHEAAISCRHLEPFVATRIRCAVELVDIEAIFGDFYAEILFRLDDISELVDIVAA